MSRSTLLFVACVSALAVVAASYGWFLREEAPSAMRSTIEIGGQIVTVDVADTEESRAQGLSGHLGLGVNEGLLFVFPNDGLHGFWMKDMRFSIDIVWISSDGEIVHVEKNVSPETYPTVFTPRAKARYVVELPAGFADAHNIGVGDTVKVK